MYSQTLKHIVTVKYYFTSIQQKYLVFLSFQKDSEESCTKKKYSQQCFTNTKRTLMYMLVQLHAEVTTVTVKSRVTVPWNSLFETQSLILENFKYWGLSCVSQRSRPLKESSIAFEKLSRQSLRLLSWKQRTFCVIIFSLLKASFLIFNSGSYLNSNIEKAGNWLLCLNSFFLVTDMDFIILKVTD